MDLIVYRRVSTARQGASGLGLEAQDMAVASYAKGSGSTILRTYTKSKLVNVRIVPSWRKRWPIANNRGQPW